MKRKSKLIYLIICILIVLISLASCAVTISDDNTDNFDYDKFDFKEIEGGYEMSQKILTGLFSSNKYEGVLQIPETYEKKPIIAIDYMGDNFGRGITELIGSKNLIAINSWTFAGRDGHSMGNLERVEFPKDGNLKRIDDMAFFKCSNLSTVIVPCSFESFGNGVFEGCGNLTTLVIYNPTPPSIEDIFNQTPSEYWQTKVHSSFSVYVPDDAVETYQQSAWAQYSIKPISSIEHILKEESSISNVIEDESNTTSTEIEQPQNNGNIGSIIASIVIGIVIIVLCVFLISDYKNKKIVVEKSEKINALLYLNSTTHFMTLQSKYTNHTTCNSKRQLDNLSLYDYLVSLIDSNESFYRSIIQKISSNKKEYNKYINQVYNIKSSATEEFCQSFGFTITKFLKYEERVFKKKILREPQVNVEIYCKATYTSPQGRNHYWKDRSFHYEEFEKIFKDTIEAKKQRQTRQHQIEVERAKMTNSLRYDILKRDNFRCQICGSSAQDGVKLHVDHIIPVAKGGQTIASNLRTLCDRCNIGKSDKM